ncbi:WecB/TagA/CpsF family glycosyltransferase [Sphingobium yanoikuyae]|jgi:alpha-1,3-mannosyltransferase|uniref:Polysaccharide biosynthesis protein GumH n=1 Tax=Sphingobium yanoikuyae TaxID=13690 RepID=A0A0J9D536_SPHYA|nr:MULTISPECIES: WecB/TagA/CpsF family glycosyltransferase [Sphingobium]ATP19586.1 polysaccharide biosynthesis protein GumH [Sphingobium yanoikuyae]KMW32483.1 polysaccharide biosynthesis protein GumH [Sphingobium yanoikuyae]MDH2133073.1 WecB/TagA/CpsF family glycosyltransferase [Sphingobium yanoikuyae]MDH2151181.1 WecB/TagA/CpsF family glycosyltransferase [Sphingobium yanoikuyae]MDH2169056.1 WecB/TagA/CpsF family glycosyltransferase [Sphingobium yanoikuyae]
MKIAHISRQYHPGLGGLESFTRNLCREQARAGHQVRMITLDRIFDGDDAPLPRCEIIDDVEVVRIPYRGGRRYPLAPSVLHHLDDCDIVHVHAVDFFADYLALTRLLHRKPLVLSTHGGFFHTGYARRLKQFYFHSMTRLSLAGYRAIIACSEADYETFAKVNRRALTLVENGVDTVKFAGLAQSPSAEHRFIYFGRIAPNKRIDLLIRWFAHLHRLDRKARLIIAGKPMGVTFADLQQIVEQLGLGDLVEFHDSPSDEALQALIARSTIFASPSAYEGFGISLIEGVSAGLYPVVSDIPAHRRSCVKLDTGSLIDFTDPLSAARTLQDIRKAQQRSPSPTTAAGLLAYGWPGVSARISAIYEHILGRQTRQIGPLRLAVLSESDALKAVSGLIRDQAPRVVAFGNAHLINQARRVEGVAAALNDALVLNDGVGVDIASRLRYGDSFPHNLNGTDFIPQLLKSYPDRLRLFLVGAAPGIAERAAAILEERHPHIRIVGTLHGFFDPQEEEHLSRHIRESGADLVIAAMGNPRQELWAAKWASHIGRPILCAGALLDFTAGHVPRAPGWLRRMRMEWIFRLMNEPTRLADRYLRGNVTFLMNAIRDARGGYSDGPIPPPSPHSHTVRNADAA